MATKTNTYSPGQIDVNNFVLGEVKTNDYGGKFVNILYKDEERGASHIPFIRTGDYMRMPFGLSETSFDDNSTPKCSVNVDFTGKDTNEKIMDTANLFTNLDKLMLKWGEENCKSWFLEYIWMVSQSEKVYSPCRIKSIESSCFLYGYL